MKPVPSVEAAYFCGKCQQWHHPRNAALFVEHSRHARPPDRLTDVGKLQWFDHTLQRWVSG